MQLVRRYPLTSFDVANQLFRNGLFNNALSGTTRNSSGKAATARTNGWTPAVDISEQDDQFLLIADVPGFTADSIEVSVDKRVLSVVGKREEKQETTDQGYSRIERVTGNFERRFTLPESVDTMSISAKVENGVLSVTIQKSTESLVQKISVQG